MSVSKKRRARALRAFVERLTCPCFSCYWWRKYGGQVACRWESFR